MFAISWRSHKLSSRSFYCSIPRRSAKTWTFGSGFIVLSTTPTENQKGWSFLRHPQNLQSALPDRQMWLLKRILENQWLQEEFIHPESTTTEPTWNQKVCQDYLLVVDAFLERLLLLIHLTAGQPSAWQRDIESKTYQHCERPPSKRVHRGWYGQHSDDLSQGL